MLCWFWFAIDIFHPILFSTLSLSLSLSLILLPSITTQTGMFKLSRPPALNHNTQTCASFHYLFPWPHYAHACKVVFMYKFSLSPTPSSPPHHLMHTHRACLYAYMDYLSLHTCSLFSKFLATNPKSVSSWRIIKIFIFMLAGRKPIRFKPSFPLSGWSRAINSQKAVCFHFLEVPPFWLC